MPFGTLAKPFIPQVLDRSKDQNQRRSAPKGMER